jgi:ZIP family zinc transporter
MFVIAIFFGREYQNLIIASSIGFASMVFGAYIGKVLEIDTPLTKSVLYGLGSGMMIMSAFLIIAPKAMYGGTNQQAAIGGIGIATGYMIGYATHEVGHIISHKEIVENVLYSIKIFEITAHSILAGSLMGIAYGTIPSLTLVFGFGIVAHKFPAGLTTVMSSQNKKDTTLILIPATAVGISAVIAASTIPQMTAVQESLIFGLSTGLFSHVAIDMTPECVGSDKDHTRSHGTIVCSTNTDKMRLISSLSVFFGGLIIASLWYVVV